MTFYLVRGQIVRAFEMPPSKLADGELLISSAKELDASTLSHADLVAIWNALPGATGVSRFKDRKTAVKQP